MGALGEIIDNTVGNAFNSNSGTNLQNFLSHFSSSEGLWAKQIDPLATFDLTMAFLPLPADEESSNNSFSFKKLGNSLVNSAESALKNATKNALNNLTGGLASYNGGLLGAIMGNKSDVISRHKDFKKKGIRSFIEYLAAANMIVGQEDWIGEKAGESISPLELNLGLYCQEVTLPNIEVGGTTTSNSVLGDFPVTGTFVKTDTQILTLKILNTKVPLMERLFYPWLRETTLPYWSYESQPYTTATIKIDMSKHADITYVFVGCRPTKIITMDANQQQTGSNLVRDVSFQFDYMFINSSLNCYDNIKDRLLDTGKTLFNSAAKLIQG